MTVAPVLSVVMATRDGASTIGDQIDALLFQKWDRPWELVVVDNGSTDGTWELAVAAAERHPRVRAVRADARPSAGYARNVGVSTSTAEFIAFVDDDDRVSDGWLAAIGEAVVAHDYVGARLSTAALNSADVRATRSPAQQHRVDRFCGVPVVAASLMALRREWFEVVGGFDEDLDALEDTDLSIRLFDRFRREPVFVPDAVCEYRLRSDSAGIRRQAFRYGAVRPLLLRRWRSVLEPPPAPVKAACIEWARLVLGLPLTVRDERRWWAWQRRAATRVGHLVGSVRHRTVWP